MSSKTAHRLDPLSPEARSAQMARVRGKETRPELRVRRIVRAVGLPARYNVPALPGCPDVTLYRDRVAVFVHGCFWHRHQGCSRSTMPVAHAAYWSAKFARNMARDRQNAKRLRALGWSVWTIWECQTTQPEAIERRFRTLVSNPARQGS